VVERRPVSNCWLCGWSESTEFLSSTVGGEITSGDLKISDSHYGRTMRIVECRKCGFRFADPLVVADLTRLYTGMVDPDYSEGGEGRIRPFRRILARCAKLMPHARTLLDVGAGTGLLCRAARDRGLDPVGVEPSGWAVEIARTRHRVEVLPGSFPHPALAGRRFDIVTLIDVIEHVTDPLGLLRHLAVAVEKGGLVVITTPDAQSLAARILGRRWWHYRVAHICFSSRATMKLALERAGLELERAERYRWYFTVGYVAERLEIYLPVGRLRKALSRTAFGRALLSCTIPVNLRDSYTYYAREGSSKGRT
jgi:2-polyprenyl-3-methyl-5-hydroxy-6-metoxy-1,4-benzoquinol methylase